MPIHRFQFHKSVDFANAEASLLLAQWGAESLYGQTRTRLESRCRTCDDESVVEIDATTQVGQDLSRLFLGFIQQEFEGSQYRVDIMDLPLSAEHGCSVQARPYGEEQCLHAEM